MRSKRSILERLGTKGLVFDGAMGSLLEERRTRLPSFDCGERLVLDAPEAIQEIHRLYLEAGADVVETCTFGGTPHKLSLYGLERRTRDVNGMAAMLARQVALDFPGALVAGSLGPTGLLSIEHRTGFADFHRNFLAQAEALLLGGVDLLLLETCNDMLETRAGILACREAMTRTGRDVPLAVSFTVEPSGRLLMGTLLETAALTVDHMGVDLIGVNCSTGPEAMLAMARNLPSLVSTPLLAMPNRGLPENRKGKAVYTLPEVDFARQTLEFRVAGFAALGGCCGTTPGCIRALRARIDLDEPLPSKRAGRLSALTGTYEPVLIDAVSHPILVGERLNVHGSRKFRVAVENGDEDAVLALAREQFARGALVLDVCLAAREAERQMERVNQFLPPLAINVSLPIMVDATEPDVQEAACRHLQGRGIINSCNLEDPDRCRRVMSVARRHGQMLVCLPLDGSGIPKEPERRLEVARRIRDLALEEGLEAQDLIFDCLVLTLGTGREEDRGNARATLETLSLFLAHLEGSRTIMGVSNVSYGLPPHLRPLVNNVLLHHAAETGLHMAIFNPMERRPLESFDPLLVGMAEDLVLNRRPDALERLLEAGMEKKPEARLDSSVAPPVSGDPGARLRAAIVGRDREAFRAALEECLDGGSPESLLEGVFLPAMREVGTLMDAQGLPLPYVLGSATLVQEGMEALRSRFPGTGDGGKGPVILATVKGDVHDIGKNLVKMVLAHNGFRVVDLGTDVSAESIVEAAKRENAALVGLSALLVSTSREMARVVKLLEAEGIPLPVLIGGAAVTAGYARDIGFDEQGHPRAGGAFYASDAFGGLRMAEALLDPVERQRLVDESSRVTAAARPSLAASRKAAIPRPTRVRQVRTFRAEPERLLSSFDFARFCGRKLLSRGPVEEGLHNSLLKTGEALLASLLRDRLLEPAGVTAVISALPGDGSVTLRGARGGVALSLDPEMAERFLTLRRRPVLPLLVVTVGGRLNDEIRRRFEKGDYLRGYLLSTVGAELAETLAEETTREMVKSLGIPREEVRRISPGYPVWPELADQVTLFGLLGAEEALGLRLSEAYQMVPEFSVSAGLVRRENR